MVAAVRQRNAEWPEAVRALLEKYRELLTFCMERDAFEAAGIFALERPDQRLRHIRARALARRFPGVLRELDGATEVGVRARIAALEEQLLSAGSRDAAPAWMRIVDDFHRSLGRLLEVKRTIAAGLPVTETERALVASPPYGKLQELVWEELAQRYGKSPAELRAIVHLGENA